MRWLVVLLLALNIALGAISLYVSYNALQHVDMVGAILWGIINNQAPGQSG